MWGNILRKISEATGLPLSVYHLLNHFNLFGDGYD
ncbi:MAG: hypothetical protein ACI9R3_001859 [Verrucomicrobiales bacterium]|jgi:hypothetical protein